MFLVTKYLKTHTCYVSDRLAQQKHCTPKYIGKLFIDRVGIIDVQDSIKNMFGMKLDYTTSYRALLYAQELVRGTTEDGYERLPSYLDQIKLANPDFITSIELDDKDRFQYQRKVIVVDGTHLSVKYGGVMLVVAAQDGNFQIFPLVFGIVDGENDHSWDGFSKN